MIQLPRLYVNGKFERIVYPVKTSITLTAVPLSTASLTLQADENLPARSWVELFTPFGSAGMFRVRSPHDAYGQETTTAELEHMISEVGDWLVKEEINEMLPAGDAVKRLFNHYKGGKWKLGTVTALGTGKIAVEAKYVRVLDALLSVLQQKTDCMMAFDFSTTPWTLNIVKKSQTVTAEGRVARNLTSAVISYDDTELITRAWYKVFSSKNDKKGTWKYKDADTIGTYGIIEGTVNTSNDMTGADVDYAVNTYLEEHKRPRVGIDIQGTELSQITGESLDKFECGKLMRLALPDYGLTVEKHINSVTFPDVYDDPTNITAKLGDDEDTVITFLHNLDSKGGGGGGGGKKKTYEERQWQEYYQSKVENDMRYENVYNRVNDAGEILEQAGLKLNSKRVLIYATDKQSMLMSQIKTQADRISLVVQGTGKNAKVNAVSITMEINKQTLKGEMRLKASNINLDGYVTAKQLNAEKAKIDSLLSGKSYIASIIAGKVTASSGTFGSVTIATHSCGFKTVTINGTTYHLLGY